MRPLKLLILSLLLLPALALLAFGPRDVEEVPRRRVVVEYWEKWTGLEEQQMRQIVDEFNDTVGRDKNIYVRYLAAGDVRRKTLVAIAGGVPPDIAGMWDHTLVQYAALDALEPLDGLAREAGITPETYKPVYWRACSYEDKLYGLVSTPGVVALLYNRQAFEQNADALRAAGLDPTRAPQTIAELDAYAAALDIVRADGRVDRVGYLPLEPDWYLPYTPIWFGGSIFDESSNRITLTDAKVIAAYDWIASYSRKLGAAEVIAFRSASGAGSNWSSPQNPFLTGTVLMEQNGPWMAWYFERYAPSLQRLRWSKPEEATKTLEERKLNYAWAAAAFPSAVPGMRDVSYCTSDVLVIPRGAKHKREAFAFLAYLNRQDVMERLCAMHCKNSPLAKVSDDFIRRHPNPYVDVFERLAASPNAHSVPQCPILQEVVDELEAVGQRVTLLQATPAVALAEAQARLEVKYADFISMQRERRGH